MPRRVVQSTLIAAALLLSASVSLAVEHRSGAAGESKAVSKAKAKPRVKPVDINSAGKAELKKLPGIDNALAEKIIAGRPYLSKADLVTQNIMSLGRYEALKSHVIALPNKASEAKFERLKKEGARK